MSRPAGSPRLHDRLRRLGPVSVDDDAARQAPQIVVVGHPEHARFVHARDAVARVRQAGGQVAVVGQQQQPFGIEVEPSDGIDVLADADESR